MKAMENKEPHTERPKQYPPETHQEAIDLFCSRLSEPKTRRAAADHVAGLLGIGSNETVPE